MIRLVDDDPRFLAQMTETLREFYPVEASAGVNGPNSNWAATRLLVCDLFLDTGSCVEELKSLKAKHPHLKILIVTGNPVAQKLMDLINLRVDGILEKPFTAHELILRIQGLIEIKASEEIQFDQQTRRVFLEGSAFSLTSTEFKILQVLASARNHRFSREDIHSKVWPDLQVAKNTLDTHFYNLKRKVPLLETRLTCVHGEGYYLS